MFRMDRISHVIITACILHNLCISENDDVPDIENFEDDNDGDNDYGRDVWPACRNAVMKREVLANSIQTLVAK